MIKIAVDAMGGDLAPVEMVAGAIEAVQAKPGIQVLLVGQEAVVNKELSKYTYNKEQIQVVNEMCIRDRLTSRQMQPSTLVTVVVPFLT